MHVLQLRWELACHPTLGTLNTSSSMKDCCCRVSQRKQYCAIGRACRGACLGTEAAHVRVAGLEQNISRLKVAVHNTHSVQVGHPLCHL